MKKVIHRRNLPRKIPLHATLTIWLMLDYYHASDWVASSILTLWALVLVGSIYELKNEIMIDLFKDKP